MMMSCQLGYCEKYNVFSLIRAHALFIVTFNTTCNQKNTKSGDIWSMSNNSASQDWNGDFV